MAGNEPVNDRQPNGEKRTRLHNHLNKLFETVSEEYGMIEPGDRILVGVSGGTDSMVLLDLLRTPKYVIPGDYTVTAVHIDLGFEGSGEDVERLEGYLRQTGCETVIDRTDIGPVAHSEVNRKNPCFLCSRLRRRRIFEIADERGCNKIAFAHHRDDMIETLLINMLYGREISTMMPKQRIFGGTLHIIRPLAYIREELVKKFARERGFPVIANRCPTSVSSRRRYVKELLDALEKDNRLVRDNLFRAMKNVKKDYMPRGGHDG
jgi:tRNA 2-thiocytidine biosynthesis protein TtcA